MLPTDLVDVLTESGIQALQQQNSTTVSLNYNEFRLFLSSTTDLARIKQVKSWFKHKVAILRAPWLDRAQIQFNKLLRKNWTGTVTLSNIFFKEAHFVNIRFQISRAPGTENAARATFLAFSLIIIESFNVDHMDTVYSKNTITNSWTVPQTLFKYANLADSLAFLVQQVLAFGEKKASVLPASVSFIVQLGAAEQKDTHSCALFAASNYYGSLGGSTEMLTDATIPDVLRAHVAQVVDTSLRGQCCREGKTPVPLDAWFRLEAHDAGVQLNSESSCNYLSAFIEFFMSLIFFLEFFSGSASPSSSDAKTDAVDMEKHKDAGV